MPRRGGFAYNRLVLWRLLCVLLAVALHAEIDTRTGNFHTVFTDVVFPDSGLRLERVYNSKSTYDGWFGIGWGTFFETRLDVRKDGSIEVVEFGDGATAEFAPSVIPVDNLEQAVTQLVEAARKAGDVATPIAADDFRREVARRFFVREENGSSTLPVNC